ncbi:MAG: oligosaccharide flippase family protein, partial [Prevotella sp.]|nr:oligosaccharide flippase family protein [Prevotella sp.]
RFFTKEVAGTYSQANTWSSKCAYLVQGMVQQVAQPILVGLNDERERQLMVLRKMMRFTAFITFPLMFGLALVAKEFIVLAITEKWLASAKLMQYLCISWATVPLTVLLSNMIVSKGKSGTYFWCTVTLAILQIILMAILSRYGMHTMVIGFVTLSCMWVLVWHYFTKRLTGYGIIMFFKDTIPFALIALGVMVVTHYLTSSIESLWMLLISRVIIAAALYFIVMKMAHAKILDECLQFLNRRKQ